MTHQSHVRNTHTRVIPVPHVHAAADSPNGGSRGSNTSGTTPNKADELSFVRALKKQGPVEHDLEKLHLTYRYDTSQLRTKVPWYRNSFEHSTPFTDILHEPPPIEMDPPLAIPKELRPLGVKRRYLRTMQLIADPLPTPAAAGTAATSAPPLSISSQSSTRDRHVSFEESLRQRSPASVRHKLQKSNSHTSLSVSSTGVTQQQKQQQQRARTRGTDTSSDVRDGIVKDCESDGEENDDSNDEDHRHLLVRARSGDLPPKSQLLSPVRTSSPADASMTQARPNAPDRSTLGVHRRRVAQQLSLEEMEDLPNYKTYFGAHAKQSFFAQYRNLYSRPYLFVEATTSGSQSESQDQSQPQAQLLSPPPSTESRYVAAYPSTRELKHIAHELAPFGTAVAAGTASESSSTSEPSVLPTRDALSPRSLFLTTCIAQPQLAVPFLLRRRLTKVFDFSFQSLGDAFMREFARCLVQDLPFVEEIVVRDNRLSDAGLDALLRAVAEGSTMLNLQRLDISQNEVGAQSAQTLRAYVASPHCTLATLLVDTADIDDRECAAFMSAFERNLSIRMLCMSRNCIGAMEHLNVVQPCFTTGGEAIASMLQRNLVLVHLDVSWNYLRLASSVTLAQSLRDNRTLKELVVAYNACGDAGAMAFGDALRVNQCLEVLDLSCNSIGAKGAMVLASALRANRTLRVLQLHGNNIGREGGQSLLAALCENETELGCDVGLQGCNISASVAYTSSTAAPVPASVVVATALRSSGGGPDAGAVIAPSLPVYSAATSWMFDPKEPTGRYILHMTEVYDKMVAMELLRLATCKKGCRFVKLEHWTGASASVAQRQHPPPGAAKKCIQLLRCERVMPPPPLTPAPLPAHRRRNRSPRAQGDGEDATTSTASSPDANTNDDADEDNDEENSLETRGLDALFAHIDCDRSGAVDEHEVMRVLHGIGLFPRVDDLHAVLARDCAGGLAAHASFSTFLFHAVFQIIDVDASGKLDADEMEDAFRMLGMPAYEPQEIAAAIATYDISGDGEIEECEFVEFMKNSLLEKLRLRQSGASPSAVSSLVASDSGDATAVHIQLLDASTGKPWVLPADGRVEIEFLYEREAFASSDEAQRHCKLSPRGIEQLLRNITQQHAARAKSEQDELFDVAVRDSDIRFTATQALQVLDVCGYLRAADEQRRIAAIALLLPQILTTKDAQVLVAQTLSVQQRYRLKTELGSAYSVVLGNPTAHYSLDLAKPKDRVALAKIAEVAQSEKLFSKLRSGRADTSQHGNWENFRNEELDGQRIVLTHAFFHVLPRRGKLAFDYVSTARPKRGTAPMTARRFEQLIRELQASPGKSSAAQKPQADSSELDTGNSNAAATAADITVSAAAAGATAVSTPKRSSVRTRRTQFWQRTRVSLFKHSSWECVMAQATSKFLLSGAETREDVGVKLVQIESAVCDRWLSCEQAAQIVACMPSAFGARAETARLLFARVIDLDRFCRLYDALAPADQSACVKTLGWLNMCNPMEPERRYELDVSIWDEREMTKLLVELAIAEPGENWINQSFANARDEAGIPGWKLPVRWEKDDGKEGGVNRSGFLEVEYYSGQDRGCAAVPSFRKTLLKRTLCGTRQYCCL